MATADLPRLRSLHSEDDVPRLVREMGLEVPRPVLVLVGGAGGLTDPDVDRLTDYLCAYVLPSIDRVGAAVVDGGTDSGVMRAIGRARRDSAQSFPLVGVVAEGVLSEDMGRRDQVVLEPHHTDLVVVPGKSWGDEVPWLGRIAAAVAKTRASVTLLVNGGEIAYHDMEESLRRDRPVVVLGGSGRTADDVAAAAVDTGTASAAARQIAASPLTVVVPYRSGPRVREVLDIVLGPAIIA